jgi:carbamoyltransferase
MRTDMDVLVVNRFVFRKENQPPWQEERNWRQDLVLD